MDWYVAVGMAKSSSVPRDQGHECITRLFLRVEVTLRKREGFLHFCGTYFFQLETLPAKELLSADIVFLMYILQGNLFQVGDEVVVRSKLRNWIILLS